jgi:hypothetical protein
MYAIGLIMNFEESHQTDKDLFLATLIQKVNSLDILGIPMIYYFPARHRRQNHNLLKSLRIV